VSLVSFFAAVITVASATCIGICHEESGFCTTLSAAPRSRRVLNFCDNRLFGLGTRRARDGKRALD
jgi:hypothetical protein